MTVGILGAILVCVVFLIFVVGYLIMRLRQGNGGGAPPAGSERQAPVLVGSERPPPLLVGSERRLCCLLVVNCHLRCLLVVNRRLRCLLVVNRRLRCLVVVNRCLRCLLVVNSRLCCLLVVNRRLRCLLVVNRRLCCLLVVNRRLRCLLVVNRRLRCLLVVNRPPLLLVGSQPPPPVLVGSEQPPGGGQRGPVLVGSPQVSVGSQPVSSQPIGGLGSPPPFGNPPPSSTVYESAASSWSLPYESSTESWQPIHYAADGLRAATNSYAFDRFLGVGGFGTVYRGEFSGGVMVAIKVPGRRIVMEPDFDRELELLSGVRHENLVTLLGFCREPHMLVYAYISNFDLNRHLHGK
ncbi:putative non-specific protein-tyrosine kinase RLK-Pelle-LRR-I-1 family [Helianthus debilis subsp. tardiflorus]